MNEKQRDAQTSAPARQSDPATHAPTHACPRAEDLVAYLYGEASADEARNFGLHMNACASCRDELAAFGGVRESIGAWRAKAFGVAPSLAAQASVAHPLNATASSHTAPSADTGATRVASAERKRSALVALREFFALSPAWLRAASVAAVLLVCALAALTVARAELRWETGGALALQLGASERVVKEIVKETASVPAAATANGVSQRQVDELVAAHRRELDALRQQLRQREANENYVAASAPAEEKRPLSPRAASNASATATRRAPRAKTAPPAARRDLAGNDEDLPRLYDLLSEVN